MGRTGTRVAGLVMLLGAVAGCSVEESAASLCRSHVSNLLGGGAKFTEVTYSQGDFVHGQIGEYRGGVAHLVAHWECSTESGEPEITFYQPVGP